MNNLIIFLSISTLLIITGCSSTCMEYRSATTAARSEKDLKRAEEWGLKALESNACNPGNDARAPFFLATEIYLPRKEYRKMAEMFTIAEQSNPYQLLENPFQIGDTPIETIEEGIAAYREQEWVKIFNNAIKYYQKEKFSKAKETIEIAILVYPEREENYSTLAFWHLEDNNMEMALNIIDRGLQVDDKYSTLYQIKADLSRQNNELGFAKELYLKAIAHSDNQGPIKIKLLNTYIELGENEIAIEFADELLNQYPNNPDIYYNVGVVYTRIVKEKMDLFAIQFEELNQLETPTKIMIHEAYNNIRQVRQFAYNAKDYFLEASDLEQSGELSTEEAVSEMKKILSNIDNIYLLNIKTLAKNVNIELE